MFYIIHNFRKLLNGFMYLLLALRDATTKAQAAAYDKALNALRKQHTKEEERLHAIMERQQALAREYRALAIESDNMAQYTEEQRTTLLIANVKQEREYI